MVAVTKTNISIFPYTIVSAGGTKTNLPAEGAGAWINVTNYNGGLLGGRIKNRSAAPGVQGQMTWQWSADSDPTAAAAKIYDLWSFGGDTTANSDTTASVPLPKEARFVRAICYGHTTNLVAFESDLAASS